MRIPLACRKTLTFWLGVAAVSAQIPEFGPDNPEGLVMYGNKQGRYAFLRKGTWTAQSLQARNGKGSAAAVSATELAAMRATMERLSAPLQATPTGSARVGFFVKESRGYSYPEADPRGPLLFEIGCFPFYNADTLRNGVFVADTGGETQSIYYEFNRLPGPQKQTVLVSETNADRQPVPFYPRPRETGRLAGLPVYDGQDLVIARAGRDPWAAAPYGRVLKAAMPAFEKDRATAQSRLDEL